MTEPTRTMPQGQALARKVQTTVKLPTASMRQLARSSPALKPPMNCWMLTGTMEQASRMTMTPITSGGARRLSTRAAGLSSASTGAMASVMPQTSARPPALPAMMDGAMNRLLEPITSK